MRTKELHRLSDRLSEPSATSRRAAVAIFYVGVCIEHGIVVVETYNVFPTACVTVQIGMYVPRNNIYFGCDWIVGRVMRLRLRGISNTRKRIHLLACDCCWSPQRSRRSCGVLVSSISSFSSSAQCNKSVQEQTETHAPRLVSQIVFRPFALALSWKSRCVEITIRSELETISHSVPTSRPKINGSCIESGHA